MFLQQLSCQSESRKHAGLLHGGLASFWVEPLCCLLVNINEPKTQVSHLSVTLSNLNWMHVCFLISYYTPAGPCRVSHHVRFWGSARRVGSHQLLLAQTVQTNTERKVPGLFPQWVVHITKFLKVFVAKKKKKRKKPCALLRPAKLLVSSG